MKELRNINADYQIVDGMDDKPNRRKTQTTKRKEEKIVERDLREKKRYKCTWLVSFFPSSFSEMLQRC